MTCFIQILNTSSRYKSSCNTVMAETMVEEEGPICKIEMVSRNRADCVGKISTDFDETDNSCRPMLKCKTGMKKKKKKYPRRECEEVATGEEEKCVDMVKLKKEKHKAKQCSFHPKTMCNPVEGRECRMVKKKVCHYLNS